MTTRNAYCKLADFKAYLTPPQNDLATSEPEDGIMERLLERASRRLDDLCGRRFYPYIATYSFDVPEGRNLWLDYDLLEITTLTNGDDNTIASTQYILHPANEYPKYAISIKQSSTTRWEEDSSSNTEQVIDLLGYWGYHDRYTIDAWKNVGTLGAAWASASTLSATLTAGHTLDPDGSQIIKIDSELMNTSTAGGTTLTVQSRGDNGSTAATHDDASIIYAWVHMEDITQLVLEIANMMYRSRFGENVEAVSAVTGAGVIITPRSLPIWAREILDKYTRRV